MAIQDLNIEKSSEQEAWEKHKEVMEHALRFHDWDESEIENFIRLTFEDARSQEASE